MKIPVSSFGYVAGVESVTRELLKRLDSLPVYSPVEIAKDQTPALTHASLVSSPMANHHPSAGITYQRPVFFSVLAVESIIREVSKRLRQANAGPDKDKERPRGRALFSNGTRKRAR